MYGIHRCKCANNGKTWYKLVFIIFCPHICCQTYSDPVSIIINIWRTAPFPGWHNMWTAPDYGAVFTTFLALCRPHLRVILRLSEFGHNRQRSQRQKWVNVITTPTVRKIITGKYLKRIGFHQYGGEEKVRSKRTSVVSCAPSTCSGTFWPNFLRFSKTPEHQTRPVPPLSSIYYKKGNVQEHL